MWDNIYKILLKVRHSASGASLIYFALIMPVFLGFAGLGFDATLWFMEKRQLQSVADSSAITAAYSLSKGETQQAILLAAKVDAGNNNFNVGGDYTIVVTSPPTTGEFVGLTNHVMVTFTRPGVRLFTSMLGMDRTTILASATAGILTNGEHCILALNETRDKALEFSGTSDVTIGCGVASNSNSSEAIYLNGTAALSADPAAQAYGDIFKGANATLDVPSPIQALSQRSENPFEGLTVPVDPVACLETNRNVRGNEPQPVRLLPGRYCDGLSISAGADVEMEPGIYIIDGDAFTMAGSASLISIASGPDPEGVAIILTGPSPAEIATVTINGGADITLKAMTSGPYKGIVFFQDPDAVYEDGINSFLGGADMDLKGAVYFPNQEVRYSGGAVGDVVPGCLLLVADKVTFSGNSVVSNNHEGCDEFDLSGAISRTIVALVE